MIWGHKSEMPTQIISVGDCSLYCSSMIIITRETPKKKNDFPSSLDSALEWQYSCGVVLYGYAGNNNNNNGKLRRFEGLERERETRGKFETFREPTWWMREIYSSENDGDDDDDDDDSLPSTQETFLYILFSTFIFSAVY